MHRPNLLEAGAAIGLIIALAILAWNFDPFGRRHRAQTQAQTATQQAKISDATSKAQDHYITETHIITRKAQEATDAVRQAPGAETPLPDAVRDSWLAGIVSLRDPDGASGSSPRKPSGEL